MLTADKHECGLDITQCNKCDTELEPGQTGLCSECREYSFDELTESAKQKAREKYTSGDYPHHDWWDCTYEDAVTCGKCMGIEIATHNVRLMNNAQRQDPSIWFSGFWSQGDGASFDGAYAYVPDAIAQITAHAPQDKELLRIATELTTMQLNQRILGLETFTGSISKRDNSYSHSGCMTVDINNCGDDDVPEIGTPDEKHFTQLMRDFADWIYDQLETEHDYLCSDEVVDERLQEEKFDVNGAQL